MNTILTKNAVRSKVKHLLDIISQESLEQQSSNILVSLYPLIEAHHLFCCFMNMDKGEVKTLPIIEKLFKHGKCVYLPRCSSTKEAKQILLREGCQSHAQLTFHKMKSFQDVLDLKPRGKYQLKEPLQEAIPPLPSKVDVMLIPGVAFSLNDGSRLGHGGGYYDDYIKRCIYYTKEKPLLVGLALNQQIVPSIPTEAHDYKMDYIICGDGSVHRFY